MVNRKIVYCPNIPYHLTARTNNKIWFATHATVSFLTMAKHLNHVSKEYGLRVHAFVLMSNHYHMIASAGGPHDMGYLMNRVQTLVSQELNQLSSRINHVFGGPYHACLIKTPEYYAHAIKYLYRNPVVAGLSRKVEQYPYSILGKFGERINVSSPVHDIDCKIPHENGRISIEWLNSAYKLEESEFIERALEKREFKFPIKRSSRRAIAIKI